MKRRAWQRRARSCRRGGIYLMVMIGSATVTSIALVGLSLAAERRQASERAVNSQHATQLAHAAVELALSEMAGNPGWRSSRGDGWWEKAVAFEGGEMAFGALDQAGASVADSMCAPVLVRGLGTMGTSRTLLEVEVRPEVVWPDDGLAVAEGLGAASYLINDAANKDPKDQIHDIHGKWRGEDHHKASEGLSCTSAKLFNGTDNYIEIGNKSELEAASGTLSLWFWYEDGPLPMSVVYRYPDNVADGGATALFVTAGGLSLAMNDGTVTSTIWAPVPEPSRWHHVAFTFGSGGLELYLNGEFVGRDATTANWISNKGDLLLGAAGGAVGGAYLKGSISHIAFFERQLHQGEVQTLMDAMAPRPLMRTMPGTWRRVMR